MGPFAHRSRIPETLRREAAVNPREFRSGEIRILDSIGNVERVIPFDERIESCDAVIRVYDEAGNVIETHEHAGEFKAW
jgi:hypothetical protein